MSAPRWVPALAMLAACSGDQAGVPGGAATDSAGIAIVEVSGLPRDRTPVPLERVFSIGGADALDTMVQFKYIPAVVRLSNGTVVVANNAEARWFDSAGAHIRTGTREGSGPGEIQEMIMTLTRLAGDTVAVTEMRGGRFRHVILSPTGEYVREWRVDGEKFASLGMWAECLNTVLPDLSMVRCLANPEDRARGPDPGPGLLRRRWRLAHVPASLDARHDLGYDIGIEQFGVRLPGSNRTNFVVHPFHARSHVAAGGTPLRIAIATNPEYSIEVWTPSGRLERIIRRVDGRRAPTDAELAWARERLQGYSKFYSPQAVAEVPVPDSLPAVSQLLVSSGGALYVGQFATDSIVYDVFDATGTYVRALAVPAGFRLVQVDGAYLVGVRTDELGAPYVEVYRMGHVD